MVANATQILFNGIVALAAIAALILAYRQIIISRELSALQAYEGYHVMCLQYPKFSSGSVDFESFDQETRCSYEMFVLYTLMVGERIYALFPKDDAWLFSITDDIRLHKSYISSQYFERHLNGQGWVIKPLIDLVILELTDQT